METRADIRAALEHARARTEDLLAPIPDDVLSGADGRPKLPLVRELAGIAYFEELWLVRNLNAQQPIAERHDELYGTLSLA